MSKWSLMNDFEQDISDDIKKNFHHLINENINIDIHSKLFNEVAFDLIYKVEPMIDRLTIRGLYES